MRHLFSCFEGLLHLLKCDYLAEFVCYSFEFFKVGDVLVSISHFSEHDERLLILYSFTGSVFDHFADGQSHPQDMVLAKQENLVPNIA